ncbi:MAG TPA: porin family protein [Thermoanaerobaculia bacterium]|nr:porin family protein [Thermoanaerobaculia bacterium]
MIQRIYRIIFVLFIAAGSSRVYAQTPSSEVGAWLVVSEFEAVAIQDDDGDVDLDFASDTGYGISFNRYWTNRFSTELSLQKFSAEITAEFEGDEFDIGDLDATAVTAMAQWHFNRDGRFSPYLGAGLARLTGDVEPRNIVEPTESLDLESEFSIAAAVGANIRLNDHFSLAGEFKYTPWSAVMEDDPDDESLDIDPITFAAGVKFRF